MSRIEESRVSNGDPGSVWTARAGMGIRLVGFAVLFLVLSAAGLWVVHRRVGGAPLVFDPALLSPPVILAVVPLLLIYFAADGLRLHFALRALGHDIPLPDIARLVFVNIFFSNITPLATGGGMAQVWYLHRRGVPLGTATAATTIRTVLAMAFIFSAAPLAIVSLDRFREALAGVPLEASLTVMVGAYAGFFAVILLRPRWLVGVGVGGIAVLRRAHLIGEARARRWRRHTKRELVRFTRAFGRFASGSPSDALLSVVFTAIFLLALFTFPAVLLWGLGHDVSYPRVVGLLVGTTFVMYFAPTPGASGVAEGVFGFVFRGMVTGSHLVLVTLAWRFLTIYVGMLVGVVATVFEAARGGPPSEGPTPPGG